MSKLSENIACAAAGIMLGVIVCFAIIGVCTVVLGPKNICTLAHLFQPTQPAEGE